MKDMKDMKDKIVDNNISFKENIANIENKIYGNKNKLKDMNELSEIMFTLKQKMSKHVDLLNKSVKGGNATIKLNDMGNRNNSSYYKVIDSIESEKENINKEIEKLYNEQDEIVKKQREENNKQNDNTK